MAANLAQDVITDTYVSSSAGRLTFSGNTSNSASVSLSADYFAVSVNCSTLACRLTLGGRLRVMAVRTQEDDMGPGFHDTRKAVETAASCVGHAAFSISASAPAAQASRA